MDLSIIIVNWKSKSFLENCLNALSSDMANNAWECIVIDNASFDGSEELCTRFSWVRFFQSQKNLGFAGANNSAALLATGKTLLFLNPDTLPQPGAIVTLLHGLLHTKNAAIAGARLLHGNGSLQTSCILPFPTLLNQLLDIEALKRITPRAGLWGISALYTTAEHPQVVQAVSGASLMMRNDVFIQVGGFSSDYFMYGEDIDLCEKTRRAGFDVILVNNAVITHFGGGSSSQSSRAWYEAVLLKETNALLLKKFKSKQQVFVYRLTTLLNASIRIFCLGIALPCLLLPRMRTVWKRTFLKWAHVFAWSLGKEMWCRTNKTGIAV